jgi:ERCC4-related helicase
LMAREIGHVFGELDLTKTQADWERAVSQAGSIEERMDIFLDSMEQSATSGQSTGSREDLVTDEEIDRMISTDVLASEKVELGKLDQLESEIAKELGTTKQKD